MLGDGSTAYAMTLAGQNLSAGKYALLACEYLCEAVSFFDALGIAGGLKYLGFILRSR